MGDRQEPMLVESSPFSGVSKDHRRKSFRMSILVLIRGKVGTQKTTRISFHAHGRRPRLLHSTSSSRSRGTFYSFGYANCKFWTLNLKLSAQCAGSVHLYLELGPLRSRFSLLHILQQPAYSLRSQKSTRGHTPDLWCAALGDSDQCIHRTKI